MLSCLEVGMALPEYILALSGEIAKRADLRDPTWRYYETTLMLTNFRAHVIHGVISSPLEILATALEIDKAALEICADAPSTYEYDTVYTDADPDIIFDGCYHVYQDYLSATVWNGIRTIRIMLHEIIRDTLPKLHSTKPSFPTNEQYTTQYQTSTDILLQMQSEIIASVPQHLGYASTKTKSGLASDHFFPWSHFNSRIASQYRSLKSKSAGPPMIRLFGGYTLPWTVYLAGAVDVANEPVQKWAVGTLQRIGRTMGIQQALVLADRLDKRDTGV